MAPSSFFRQAKFQDSDLRVSVILVGIRVFCALQGKRKHLFCPFILTPKIARSFTVSLWFINRLRRRYSLKRCLNSARNIFLCELVNLFLLSHISKQLSLLKSKLSSLSAICTVLVAIKKAFSTLKPLLQCQRIEKSLPEPYVSASTWAKRAMESLFISISTKAARPLCAR